MKENIEKVNSRCFYWFLVPILVHQNGTLIDMASRYKALHVLAKNSETVGHEDLICCVTVKMIYKLSSCKIESNVSSLN